MNYKIYIAPNLHAEISGNGVADLVFGPEGNAYPRVMLKLSDKGVLA
jgi:hypothetical protein